MLSQEEAINKCSSDLQQNTVRATQSQASEMQEEEVAAAAAEEEEEEEKGGAGGGGGRARRGERKSRERRARRRTRGGERETGSQRKRREKEKGGEEDADFRCQALAPGKSPSYFRVGSPWDRWVLEAVRKKKILLDVKVPPGVGRGRGGGSEVLKTGAALPRGQGRSEPGGGGEEEEEEEEEEGARRKRPGQKKPGAPGAPKGSRQSGNEPWGGALCGNASAPQHAADLINPLGKTAGRWPTDCSELEKLTCATMHGGAARSDSPPATETESSRTGRGGTWLLPPVPGEEDKKGRWTWRWPRPSNAPILGN
eukprot:XP_022280732.1 uncharacterized protein LOC111097909 [Canis lupus familiaris]